MILNFMPSIWVILESHAHRPTFNAIYFIVFRLCSGTVYTFVFMCNSRQLREFFTHPQDKEIFNSLEKRQSSSEKINNQVDRAYENNSMNAKKIPQDSKHRILHIISTLWRSAYYVHLCMIIIVYSIQRWPLNSTKQHVSLVYYSKS